MKISEPQRYSGDATVRIKKNGKIVVTTTIEYDSIEEAGIMISNPEIVQAMTNRDKIIKGNFQRIA
jgi:hypothetical protein